MLGENLGSTSGRTVVQRVLASSPGGARTESTHRGGGTLLGVNFQDSTTYECELRPDGTIFGEGRGLDMGEGGELATWVGHGVGTFSDDGTLNFRGAIYVYSNSEKWQRLNAVACVYEYEVDADDNYKGELWEWK